MEPNQHKVIETEIIGLEQKFWDAMKNKDVKTMEELTYETCILTGAHGATKFKKEDFSKMMDQQPYELVDFKFQDDWQVSVLSDDMAVIAYKIEENITIDGETVKINAADSSTWFKRDGKWVCGLHSESIIGDPFGRDRNSMN